MGLMNGGIHLLSSCMAVTRVVKNKKKYCPTKVDEKIKIKFTI